MRKAEMMATRIIVQPVMVFKIDWVIGGEVIGYWVICYSLLVIGYL
jgi:hypothetical protein